jgi:tellurite resistance protein TerC
VFSPTRIHGRFYEDGAVTRTSNFVEAIAHGADLVFALDSIPAIFGVTRDPFVIYTSNVFAILGLRAMYFLIAALLPRFRFLKHGLSVVLVLIGLRMLADRWIEIPTALTLVIVCAILGGSVLTSMLVEPKGGDRS